MEESIPAAKYLAKNVNILWVNYCVRFSFFYASWILTPRNWFSSIKEFNKCCYKKT
jgi:hypothetical protein